MTWRSAVWTGVALAALGIGGIIFTGVAGAPGLRLPWPQSGGGQGYNGTAGTGGSGMGFGDMMGGQGRGMMGTGSVAGARLINAGNVDALVRQGNVGATIDRKTNTVSYAGNSVTLVALASPHGAPNMTWEIDGLVNPTVVVRSGTKVTVDLVNTDWGYLHGFELTTTPPPYAYMAMMGAASNLLMMPLPARTTKSLTNAAYHTSSATFTASAGTYYYLCPVPGHAQQGMHGVLQVTA